MGKEKSELKNGHRYAGDEDIIHETYVSNYGDVSWSNLIEEMEAYDQAITSSREKRNEFNAESARNREIRDGLSSEVKSLIAQVKQIKAKRNESNAEVKRLKGLRSELTDKLRALKSDRKSSVQTTGGPSLRGRRQVRPSKAQKQQVEGLQKTELEKAVEAQQASHERVVETSTKAQALHDEMLSVQERVGVVRKKQEEAHRTLRASKRKADKHHDAMLMFLSRRNFLRDMLREDN